MRRAMRDDTNESTINVRAMNYIDLAVRRRSLAPVRYPAITVSLHL